MGSASVRAVNFTARRKAADGSSNSLPTDERFRSTPFALEAIYTSLDEGLLASHLNAVTAKFPAVSIGSYPKFEHPDYKVKVTLESKNALDVAAAAEHLRSLLPAGSIVQTPANP